MAWNKQLTLLRDAMAFNIPFKEDILPIVSDADINWINITMSASPVTLWHNILSYADNNGMLDKLVDVLFLRFPKNPHLIAFQQQLDYGNGPDVKDLTWKNTEAPSFYLRRSNCCPANNV